MPGWRYRRPSTKIVCHSMWWSVSWMCGTHSLRRVVTIDANSPLLVPPLPLHGRVPKGSFARRKPQPMPAYARNLLGSVGANHPRGHRSPLKHGVRSFLNSRFPAAPAGQLTSSPAPFFHISAQRATDNPAKEGSLFWANPRLVRALPGLGPGQGLNYNPAVECHPQPRAVQNALVSRCFGRRTLGAP